MFKTVHDLETPSVLIDLDRVEANIKNIQARCDALGLALRPHIKTHKMPEFAQMQVEAGAKGIACQKVSEAEVFADMGFDDIQLPYNIVGERKTARLAVLAKRIKLTVTVDSLAVLEGIISALTAENSRLSVLIELVTDGRRTGASLEDALEIAVQILANSDCLEFAGLMAYPSSPATSDLLREARERFSQAGISIPMMSGGSSGALMDEESTSELDEVRMGTYIFWDWRSVTLGWANFEDCAMKVRATVVSANDAERVILDSGSKTLASETIDGLYGYIVEAPQARIYKLNEEHAHVDFSACDFVPKVGDILHIIPVHTCVVTNLHNQVFGLRGEAIEKVYPVAARGLVW